MNAHKLKIGCLFVLLLAIQMTAQTPPQQATILHPARVFDGDTIHENWVVFVRGDKIERVGPPATLNAASRALPGRIYPLHVSTLAIPEVVPTVLPIGARASG